MCGICGIVAPHFDAQELRSQTEQSVAFLRHRGPDGHGVWTDPAGVALGHARLSILDLRKAAGQPMLSRDERWALTYNGEVYNFAALRRELESTGTSFRTTSDTEVLVEALALWGVPQTLNKLDGMFAFGAWDRETRKLYLARDRVGQKPLFYGYSGQGFVFGSELRVLKAYHPEARISREACALMLRYKAVPAPYTIYKNFQKLLPGHWLTYDLKQHKVDIPQPYWQPHPADAVPTREELKETFRRAVAARLVSDVPLGAFLSGGIDSSLVVATMQQLSGNPVKTFTIGFSQSEFDEAVHAAAVAQHLGTDHTELRVSQGDLLNVVPDLPRIYDEPFGDSSQIPTILVSRMARHRVTVALSGDGGDEGFAGYNRHTWLPRILRGLQLCPGPILQGGRWLLSLSWTERVLVWLADKKLLPVRMVRDKLDKLRSLLDCQDYQQLYRQALSDTSSPRGFVPGAVTGWLDEAAWQGAGDPLLTGCLADLQFYLPNDILVKVDRASMSCGLEARSPFLDHHVLEQALAAPAEWKVGSGGGKLILREWLAEVVPRELFERPKMGFAVPLAEWLRGDLKDWGNDLLAGRWLQSGDILEPTTVEQLWREHQSGARRHHHLLWNVLMLLAWLEENG
jgi:asparagine synthase (glutamine-hydrolysing)